jgi:ribosomal protein S12 methylthiotransferase
MAGSYWLETLGCPKNQVDSDKLAGLLQSEGFSPASQPGKADLVVVNTCAFIQAAREESIETVIALAAARKGGARLVVTGCMAERYGQELADALPEVDQVAGFGVTMAGMAAPGGVPVALTATRRRGGTTVLERPLPSFDLLNLPRPPAQAPWAYVKVAEGCDRRCGFCAIPSFRGPQRSRATADILAEIEVLRVQEVVLVAQDLVSWGRDASDRQASGRQASGRQASGRQASAGETSAGEASARGSAGPGPAPGAPAGEGLVALLRAARELVARVRLLYLYPSGLTDELIDAVGESGCPYFDLSLQHVSRPLLRRMRRVGDGDRFLEKVASIRRRFPDATLRSSFIVGYPGETEEDHDALLAFLAEAQLDWVGFFAFSPEDGTYAAGLNGRVPSSLVAERLRECSEVQDAITADRRAALVGTRCRALVDARGQARSHREAPEIDGVIQVPAHLAVGTWAELEIIAAVGPDLVGQPVGR